MFFENLLSKNTIQ